MGKRGKSQFFGNYATLNGSVDLNNWNIAKRKKCALKNDIKNAFQSLQLRITVFFYPIMLFK